MVTRRDKDTVSYLQLADKWGSGERAAGGTCFCGEVKKWKHVERRVTLVTLVTLSRTSYASQKHIYALFQDAMEGPQRVIGVTVLNLMTARVWSISTGRWLSQVWGRRIGGFCASRCLRALWFKDVRVQGGHSDVYPQAPGARPRRHNTYNKYHRRDVFVVTRGSCCSRFRGTDVRRIGCGGRVCRFQGC